MNEDSDRPLDFPLRCRPLLKQKIWGGRGLERILGKALPPDEPIGESWEVADVPEGRSGIEGGPLAGMSLREVMADFSEQMLPGSRDAEFPLLVKFLDAQDDISIQVHPDAEVCERLYPGERSKNETWLVVHVEPGGTVLHGVREGVDLDEICSRIADGSIVEVMRRIEVRPGDVIHLPAGTLHALMRGVMLLEVQEPSDSTFRVYDHDRLGQDGRPRDLHIEQALRSLHMQQAAAARIVPRTERQDWGDRELLIDIEPYRVERLRLTGEMVWRPVAISPSVVVTMAGELVASWAGGEMAFSTGETFIVPPGVEGLRLAPAGDRCEVVVASARRPGCERPNTGGEPVV
ncbi:MAG: type I phosphomannose isomerase catalytic subunit [Armatimonadota bacterium]